MMVSLLLLILFFRFFLLFHLFHSSVYFRERREELLQRQEGSSASSTTTAGGGGGGGGGGGDGNGSGDGRRGSSFRRNPLGRSLSHSDVPVTEKSGTFIYSKSWSPTADCTSSIIWLIDSIPFLLFFSQMVTWATRHWIIARLVSWSTANCQPVNGHQFHLPTGVVVAVVRLLHREARHRRLGTDTTAPNRRKVAWPPSPRNRATPLLNYRLPVRSCFQFANKIYLYTPLFKS